MFLFAFYDSAVVGKAWLNIVLMMAFYLFFEQEIDALLMSILCFGIAAISFDLIMVTSILVLFFIVKAGLENKDPFGKMYFLFIPYMFVFFI